jgi:hypothetical protein
MMHDLIQGHQITSNSPASSFLVIDSSDRSTANSSQGGLPLAVPITQPFNNFKLQKPQALLQGGFKSLKLTEVRFPYAIPNVLTNVNNSFWITLVRTSTNITARISISGNVFYEGDALALAVQTALNASAVGGAASTSWTVIYQDGGIFMFAGAVAANIDFLLYPINPANIGTQSLQQNSLLNVLGFDPLGNWDYLTTVTGTANTQISKVSSWAPLTYTSYIDFVSNNLTKYQEVNDSSSKTNSTGAVILRLFLNDETSTVPIKVYDASGVVVSSNFGNAGSFPFVIHRQFICPKVFKWNPGASIDAIDLQLFDDSGAPLQVPQEGLPNFQITFLATEE